MPWLQLYFYITTAIRRRKKLEEESLEFFEGTQIKGKVIKNRILIIGWI